MVDTDSPPPDFRLQVHGHDGSSSDTILLHIFILHPRIFHRLPLICLLHLLHQLTGLMTQRLQPRASSSAGSHATLCLMTPVNEDEGHRRAWNLFCDCIMKRECL